MQAPKLSAYGCASSVPSPVNRMMAAFANDFRPDTDINLGVGYVNEDTMPRDAIQNALQEVLTHPENHPAALNYGGSRGSQNLIDAIRDLYLTRNLGGVTPGILARTDIIIGPNGATSLLEGIAHVLTPGLVITADPIYYIFGNVLERLGHNLLAVPEDKNGLQPDLLRLKLDAIGNRRREISFFYIVTVNNPTGTILSNARRKEIVAIASELSVECDRQIPVFFDTAYEQLLHDPSVPLPQSGLTFDTDGLVYEIGTLSKILAPALRIGYLIGRPGALIDALVQKTNDAGFSASLITQEIAGLLLRHHLNHQLDTVNAGYRNKALTVRKWLDQHLGENIARISGGQAGFYFYLTFKNIETHERSPLFNFLARTTGDPNIDGQPRNPRVIYVPGEFCVHPRGDMIDISRRQLRLSYGFESLDRIEQAIELMAEAVAYAGKNPHPPSPPPACGRGGDQWPH